MVIERVRLAGQPAFGMDLGSGREGRRLDEVTFEAAESLDASGTARAITFRARDPGGALIRQTYRLQPDDTLAAALTWRGETSRATMTRAPE